MKVKDMKAIIRDLDDDVDIEVNSVLDEEIIKKSLYAIRMLREIFADDF